MPKVQENFNTEKDQLLARYRCSTEIALEQADFLNYPDIVILQALTIYLGVLQNTGDMRSAWFLNGVLVRLAVSMKLHRDGSHFANTAPFETEVRRRLWWQICLIDSRSEVVQDPEYRLSESMFDTEMPANVDDADLQPGLSMLPTIVDKWTDMTVFLLRCEIWKLSRKLQSLEYGKYALPSKIDERLQLFQQSQAPIEDTYLKHLDSNQPLHSFVATSARLFLTKVDLIIHTMQHSARAPGQYPTENLPDDKIFQSSLSIIEYNYALQNEPSWGSWRWQIHAREPPWHALRVVLNQLRTRHWTTVFEGAWSSAKKSFDSLSEDSRRDPRYQYLSLLVSAVGKHRTSECKHQQTSGVAMDASIDLTSSAMAMTLSAPLLQDGIGGTGPTWRPEEPSLSVPSEPMNNDFSEDPMLGFDWQAWDGNAEGSERSFDFWNMSGL